MKSFTATTLAFLGYSLALVAGLPLQDRTTVHLRSRDSSSGVQGAAYFMTNEPTGNFVIAADIGSDGTLTLNRAVVASGLGSHGVSNPIGPDALFAQGSVKASAAGGILAVVNPGSNTISAFSINPSDPSAITMIGEPVSSEGEFPMSLAVSDSGNMVCVLNGGAVNGVNCFSVNKQSGLVSMPNSFRSLELNQTTPPSGPPGSTSHIVFSEDGSQLIASVKGIPPTPGFIAVWDIDSNGSLSPNFTSIAPQPTGALPFSMTVVPGENALLVTDPGVGFDIFDLSAQPDTNGTAAGKSSAVPIDGQSATCWSSFSNKMGNFYLTDIGTGIVTEVNVDNNLKGSIVQVWAPAIPQRTTELAQLTAALQQYPQGNGTATIDNDVATVNGNDFLYVLAANATSVHVLSLPAPGQAQLIQTLDFAGPIQAAGLTINPNNVQGMTVFVTA
ncbi:hypothetical protein CERSUDRAFT_126221 [Gelatoporia subvermispora B]|uniref:3-carboxymuconate cyclase n=1 Tax=Ceriporiopsis subvermispora (strain B) TaxID=914234 RepID=M2R3P4_CERS8|nr:hypothetical protein CERSUDRAFT_126221 [Gelatoporia subvermispora B]